MEGITHHGGHRSSQIDLTADWQQEWPALSKEWIPGRKRTQREAWKGDRARTVPPRPPDPGGLPSPSLGSTLLPHRIAPRRSLRHTSHPKVDEMVMLDNKGKPQYMWHTSRYGMLVPSEGNSDSDSTNSPSDDETSSDNEREVSSVEE